MFLWHIANTSQNVMNCHKNCISIVKTKTPKITTFLFFLNINFFPKKIPFTFYLSTPPPPLYKHIFFNFLFHHTGSKPSVKRSYHMIWLGVALLSTTPILFLFYFSFTNNNPITQWIVWTHTYSCVYVVFIFLCLFHYIIPI